MLKKECLYQNMVSIILLMFCLGGCKKMVTLNRPVSFITTSQVFATEGEANGAMAGVYYSWINDRLTMLSGGATIYGGLSSDELHPYNMNNVMDAQFFRNDILPSNSSLNNALWTPQFKQLYSVNSIIDGVHNSASLTLEFKTRLLAQAKFVRAFIHFYLLNFFGEIPYVTGNNWRENRLLSRRPTLEVYSEIVKDLKEAQAGLAVGFALPDNARIIPNRLAATALLARVYLYTSDWNNAVKESSALINSGALSLNTDVNKVFAPDNPEAIWQLKQDNTGRNRNGTIEGITLVPSANLNTPPYAYVDSNLINSMDEKDLRKNAWIASRKIRGTTYNYPYKYKTGRSQAVAGGAYSEYYTAFRLAEQFLIRSEAKAQLNKIAEAISDLNIIRQRAGLEKLPASLTKDELSKAILQERRIELMFEWGHRWLDLKRLNKTNEVLGSVKGPNWQDTDVLYPIPESELRNNPSVLQNPGY